MYEYENVGIYLVVFRHVVENQHRIRLIVEAGGFMGYSSYAAL